MLHFSKFKIAGLALVVLAGIVFSLPNFMSQSTRLNMPDFLQSSALNLGLDLQGGSHLLLSVDTQSVQRERLDSLIGDVRLALRGARINYTGLGRAGEGVSVTIRDASQVEQAADVLSDLALPVDAAVFGGFSNAVDLDIAQVGEASFSLTLTDEAIIARNTRTLQQSI